MTAHSAASGPRIVCLGDLMVDVVARLSGPLETGSDRPAHIELRGGGSAANTAAWLAHIGVETTLVARVGSDPLGEWSRTELPASLAAGITVDRHAPTGTCIVLVSVDGERTMIPDAGANATLRPDGVDMAAFGSGAHLHVSGYTLFGPARAAALHAMRLARHAGMTLSVGASSSAPLAALGADQFLRLVGEQLVLFANRDEATVLTGLVDPREAARSLSERVGSAIVTQGPDGASWSQGDDVVHVSASRVDDADTTGAGDAFAAAVLDQWLRGAAPAAALQAGHTLAAEACRRVGARP